MHQWEKIHALSDGELEGQEKAEALELVQSDPQAHNELLWIRAMKDAMRDKCPRHENPELFRVCMVRVAEIEKTKRIEGFVGRYAWAACAVVVATVCIGALATRVGGPAELNQTNMAGLFGRGLVAVPGAEANAQQVVERTMGPLHCDVRPRGMVVREVAQGSIEGRLASRVRLSDGQGQLVLFILDGVGAFEGHSPLRNDYSRGIINGATSVSWSEGSKGYLLIGARAPEDLAELADGLRGSR